MEASKDFLKKKNIYANISFSKTPVRTIKLDKDKMDTVKDKEGSDVEGIRYLVYNEDGEHVTFFTGSEALIQQLSQYKPGDVVKVEMKKKPGKDGGITSYYEVNPAKAVATKPEAQPVPVEEPVVNLDEPEEEFPSGEEIPF